MPPAGLPSLLIQSGFVGIPGLSAIQRHVFTDYNGVPAEADVIVQRRDEKLPVPA